jgi:hypothetical protein
MTKNHKKTKGQTVK